jgi:cytochrome c5
MKKILGILSAMVMLTIVVSLTLTPFTLSSQKKNQSANAGIPEKVKNIVKTSCMACHSDKGSGLAPGALNLDQWDTYSLKKQIKKASTMCREITNGTMPPSKYVAQNPAAKLNAEKVKVICDWATSLTPAN